MAISPRYSMSARWRGAPLVSGRVPSGEGWIAPDVGAIGSGLSIAADVLDVLPSIKKVIGCPMHPGAPLAFETLLLMVFTDPYILPANMAGTLHLARTNPASTVTLTVSLYQAGVWATYGNILVGTGGALTLPTAAQASLATGDGIYIPAPSPPDANWSDFTLAIPIFRTL